MGEEEKKPLPDAESTKKDDGALEKGAQAGKKLPYPRGVFFIITTEFCERFSYYGMKAVLSLFLNQELGYDETNATVLYHAFTALCYFTPIIGAVLADSFLGKYRTIFYVSVLYAIGQGVLTVGAIGEEEIPGLPASALAFVGLFLIAVGTGGIKPCVASFGGEQFKLPEQQPYMKTYFSLFYAAINSGSLISTILTPILRQEVECGTHGTCYPAAFGVPAALMVLSIVIFVAGKLCGFYTLLDPKENIIVKTSACIWHAFTQWWKRRKTEKKDSILDYAEKKYGKSFIDDVKSLKSVTYMFLPFPIFWALFDQQGSRWTFQATRMNGDTFGWQILPDQMQVTNPILILLFIPIFDYGVYPLLAKFNILQTPLKKIVVGGIFASASFFVSGGLEMVLEKTYPIMASDGFMNVTVYNGFNASKCDVSGFEVFHPDDGGKKWDISFTGEHLDFLNLELPVLDDDKEYRIGQKTIECENGKTVEMPEFKFFGKPPQKQEKEPGNDAFPLLFTLNVNKPTEGLITTPNYRERIAKSENGFPYVKVIWNIEGAEKNNSEVWIRSPDSTEEKDTFKIKLGGSANGDTVPIKILEIGDLEVTFLQGEKEKLKLPAVPFKVGSNYQFVIQYSESGHFDLLKPTITHKITEENSVYIMWLLPQFIIMTAAEIMFSITSLEFSYTQAPESMKAVMMSVRFLTNAFGNVLNVVVISLLKGAFKSQSHEFFLFASLMFVDSLVFAWMAMSYKYVDYTTGKGRDLPTDANGDANDEKEKKEKS